MTCHNCRIQMDKGVTDLNFRRNNLFIVLRQVSADICPQCGESYIDGATAEYIDELINYIFSLGEKSKKTKLQEITSIKEISLTFAAV